MVKYVAIIGAGIAGLPAIKQCLDNDLIPICFEQNSFIGGLWRNENCEKNKDPYSTIYKGVLTNTSKEMSTYSDFPIPAEWPIFLNQTYVEKYIDMYAENFNLLPHIKFNTTVLKISILPDKRWKVKYIIQSKNQEEEEIFDFVMVCSGHHSKPKWPEFKGMNFFKGEQLHSYKYKRAIDFENKRVLVVGGSFSAMDIAVELSNVASQVYISIRSGKLPWILPRFVNGKTTDHFTRFNAYIIPPSIGGKIIENIIIKSFPIPSHLKLPTDPLIASAIVINSDIYQCFAAGTIIMKPNIKEFKFENNQIEFIDETILENIDVIIYSTGYYIDYPFLEKHIYTGGDEIEQEYEKDFHDIVWLYRSIFPPKYPNIAFIGLTNRAGSLLPICEMQARYVTSLIKGFIKSLPSQNEMENSIRKHYENSLKKLCKSARSSIHYNYLSYMDNLSKDIGCYPYPYEIFKKFGFNFWKLFMFGMATPIQYRLIGRESWEGAKDAISLYNEYSFKNSTRGSRGYKSWIYILIVLLILLNRNGGFKKFITFLINK
ncbi:dimethylaniline monooxygenase N-oxide-forming 5-like [Gigaspora margarita]|uniref:Flavin-containing monooxygenase 1 n=1 Tax=Gigaspora margarita TaxID=4874 RepID=A0A8H4B230_GIGMA|nr:dimethylaniline monooxygenase N-oxide-forming 5-like [Gigaspora margarita]